MPPKAKKFPKQLVTLSDAEAISEVVLRFTTDEIPDVDLPPACEQAKKAWLSTFHKNVMRKFREGCVDDSEVPLDAVEDGDVEALRRLEILSARVKVQEEKVRALRAEVLEANAQNTLQINAKRRKLASEGGAGSDALVVPQSAKAVAPPISEGNLIRLQASVEKTVNNISDTTKAMHAQSKSIMSTINGVKRSIELRANESQSLGNTLGGQHGIISDALTALPLETDATTTEGITTIGSQGVGSVASDPTRRLATHLSNTG